MNDESDRLVETTVSRLNSVPVDGTLGRFVLDAMNAFGCVVATDSITFDMLAIPFVRFVDRHFDRLVNMPCDERDQIVRAKLRLDSRLDAHGAKRFDEMKCTSPFGLSATVNANTSRTFPLKTLSNHRRHSFPDRASFARIIAKTCSARVNTFNARQALPIPDSAPPLPRDFPRRYCITLAKLRFLEPRVFRQM